MVGFQQRLCQQSLMQLEHFNLEDSTTPEKRRGWICVCVLAGSGLGTFHLDSYYQSITTLIETYGTNPFQVCLCQ